MRFRGRGRRWASASALATLAALAAALLLGARAENAVSASTCTDSQLVPNVAELLVSQGAPGYARLARGKETIVRAYLTNPTTCTLSNRQSITPVSARVSVSYSTGGPAPAQTTDWCAAGTCSNYAPLAGKLGAAAQIYSTSDPIFVIPDFYLAPNPLNTGAYNITFTLKITYSRNGSTTYNTTTGTETNATKTVPVDKKTNALRVLIVPMGDPTSASPQWSSAAETTLQNAMTNAARAFPFPTGISPALTTTATGGVRYVVSTTLLDAKSLGLYKTSGSTTKFCATGANWNTSQVTSGAYAGHTLKADLLQRLADYNLYNNPPADLVLGVVDGAIAWKSTDGLGCDDGRAAVPAAGSPGQIAWVRVANPTTGTDPSTYPTPLQMELLHPFGISRTGTFHSPNVEADALEPDHGYNVLLRKVISTASGALGTNDHSIMNYNTTSIPYTKDNTLLEPGDWSDALCDLGGVDSTTPVPFASCSLNSALGTSQGVAGGHIFYQLSGICTGFDTNNNCTGIRVTQGKANQPGDVETGVRCELGSPPLPACPPTDGGFHLLLCTQPPIGPAVPDPCSDAANVKKDVGLALLPDEGHDGGTGIDLKIPDSIDALVEMDSAWTDAALTLNGVEVFKGSASDPRPDITSTSTVTPGTVVTSFPGPACCNGRAIAFDGTNLYTTVSLGSAGENHLIRKITTSGAALSSVDTGTVIGALAYNSGHLYGGDYTGNGNVYDINPSDGSKSVLFPFTDPGSCLFGGSYIDGLEYRPTAGNLALSGDACDTVFIKKLDGTAVSQFSTDNNSGISTDGAGGLWLARLDTSTDSTRLTHVPDPSTGTVSGDDIIISNYEAEDVAYDSVTFAPTCVLWMNEATFGTPEIKAVAVPCGAPSSGQSAAVQTTNTKFVSLFFTCGPPSNLTDDKPTFPLANGLRPDASGEVVAAYTDKLFCNDGTDTPKIISEASNGWTSTGLNDAQAVQTVNSATPKTPIVNIASPLNGSKYRRGEFIHYEGSATDGEQESIVTGLQWYFDGTPISPEGTGTQSLDKKLAANTPLGNHTITLKATDNQTNVGSTSVTISIGPALCPSTSKCP